MHQLQTILLGLLLLFVKASESGMTLRVRLIDGSMRRVVIPPDVQDTLSLRDALSSLLKDTDSSSSILVGSQGEETNAVDASQTLSALKLKNGALVTIRKQDSKKTSSGGMTQKKTSPSDPRWDPYPELAKDYEQALRRIRTRRSSSSGMSYGDLATLQSAMHVVEPQKEGPLRRVYMCAASAARFQKNAASSDCRLVGLLLGRIQRERVDPKSKRARTSLSTPPSYQDFCTVAKVHAVWETSQPPSKILQDTKTKRVLEVAGWLGLRPVGWIFGYQDARAKDDENDDVLPVMASEIKEAAQLQIANMQGSLGREEGCQWITLAMDAPTGATEAFQLSKVCVQMVSEGLWQKQEGRFTTTHPAVVVDGQETTQLDSVLCLVNTALLSHEGAYAAASGSLDKPRNVLSKRGTLTKTTRKALLKAVEGKGGESSKALPQMCDLNVLMGLDSILPNDDFYELCQLVRKWERGQKQGTVLTSRVQRHLLSSLES